jgi:hypothetical protein
VWVLGREEFAFGLALGAVFVVLTVAGVAMQHTVSMKMGPGFLERLAELQRGGASR